MDDRLYLVFGSDNKLYARGADSSVLYNVSAIINSNFLLDTQYLKVKTFPFGVIVPFYVYPFANNAFTNETLKLLSLIKSFRNIPFIVIVNPNSGNFNQTDLVFTRFINLVYGAGGFPIGYIPTGYGNRSLSEIKQNIDRWKQHYPNIKGLFFDEMEYNVNLDRWNEIIHYASSKGFYYLSANPGVAIPEDKLHSLNLDLIVTYENNVVNLPPTYDISFLMSYSEQSLHKRAILLHSINIFDSNILESFLSTIPKFGYFFVSKYEYTQFDYDSLYFILNYCFSKKSEFNLSSFLFDTSPLTMTTYSSATYFVPFTPKHILTSYACQVNTNRLSCNIYKYNNQTNTMVLVNDDFLYPDVTYYASFYLPSSQSLMSSVSLYNRFLNNTEYTYITVQGNVTGNQTVSLSSATFSTSTPPLINIYYDIVGYDYFT